MRPSIMPCAICSTCDVAEKATTTIATDPTKVSMVTAKTTTPTTTTPTTTTLIKEKRSSLVCGSCYQSFARPTESTPLLPSRRRLSPSSSSRQNRASRPLVLVLVLVFYSLAVSVYFIMPSFKSLALFSAAAGSSVLAAPTTSTSTDNIAARSKPTNPGTHDGMYYRYQRAFDYWEGYTLEYDNIKGGFAADWEGGGAEAGKGWRKGSADKVIKFEAETWTNEGAWLASFGQYGASDTEYLYYYIIEDALWQTPAVPGARLSTYLGAYECDGSEYDAAYIRLYQTGKTPMIKVLAERKDKRTSGTLTTACHFDAWRGFGVVKEPKEHGGDQLFGVAGEWSNGKAKILVSEG